MAKNMVIAGKFEGHCVDRSLPEFQAMIHGTRINKETVEKYEVVTEEMRKSASSGILRAGIGAALLGPIGLIAGLSAKNRGSYCLIVTWKDGEQSLIEVDDKIYKRIMKDMF